MIDLERFTKGGTVKNLSGKERGLSAREEFRLDDYDNGREPVVVRIPDNVYAISTSFFCGMFGKSYQTLGKRRLREIYRFETSEVPWPQIEQGLDRCAFQFSPLTEPRA